MACRGFASSNDTLYQVFVHSPIALRFMPIRPRRIPILRANNQSPRRSLSKYAKPTQQEVPSPFQDPKHPIDEAISSRVVNWVDASDTLHLNKSLARLLSSLDRKTHHVRQVATHPENGYPIVKIAARRDMQHDMQMKLAYKKAQRAPEAARKELELAWSIDRGHDLGHRLAKLVEFLREGRGVDILIAPKKGKRKVSDGEAAELVKEVKEAALAVPGVKESRAMEGQVGKQITMHFKAQQAQTRGGTATATAPVENDEESVVGATTGKAAAMVKSREEKLKEKEIKKAEWKAEIEDRAARKREREKEIQAQRGVPASA